MSELPKLLLKAFRSLSDEEQETVMSELLEAGRRPGHSPTCSTPARFGS
jgi:hypothetical protein